MDPVVMRLGPGRTMLARCAVDRLGQGMSLDAKPTAERVDQNSRDHDPNHLDIFLHADALTKDALVPIPGEPSGVCANAVDCLHHRAR